ncbi:MAG: NADH-quinone oxidoreductase subunit H [Dissulfuribacterales bacterium]
MRVLTSILLCILSIAITPLLSAIITKTKAFLVGKQGPPLLINYYTLVKLLKKGSVYSESTTFVFRTMPVISLAVSVIAILFLPIAKAPSLISFSGDVILVLYLFGIARFFLIIAALDTASPFEGMGAAREAYFSFLCEATLFTVLMLFYKLNGTLSLTGYFTGTDAINIWRPEGAILILIAIALFIVLLAENSRVPVDDPATHLELTMIHEVMILDHSGPDLAFIEMGSWLKLFFYATLIADLLLPNLSPIMAIPAFLATLTAIYLSAGIVESITARFRMKLVPKFILTSFALAFFAVILVLEM